MSRTTKVAYRFRSPGSLLTEQREQRTSGFFALRCVALREHTTPGLFPVKVMTSEDGNGAVSFSLKGSSFYQEKPLAGAPGVHRNRKSGLMETGKLQLSYVCSFVSPPPCRPPSSLWLRNMRRPHDRAGWLQSFAPACQAGNGLCGGQADLS